MRNVLVPLLMVAIPPNAHAKNKHSADTYDKHGCCLSCGYLWCEEKGRCIEEWASCDPGAGDVSTCKFSWAGLSWDLSPLRKAAPYYEITDAFSHPGENYSYAIGICQDVASSSKNDDNTWVGSGGGCARTTGDAYESSEAASPAYQARQWCRQWFCGSRTDMSNPPLVRWIPRSVHYWFQKRLQIAHHKPNAPRQNLDEQLARTSTGSECHRLSTSLVADGDDDDGSKGVQWGLIDPMNPAVGIFMQYTGGDTCKNTVTEKAQCTGVLSGTT